MQPGSVLLIMVAEALLVPAVCVRLQCVKQRAATVTPPLVKALRLGTSALDKCVAHVAGASHVL